jgi:FKBP-type peptidyl-prolyl cis-trans isomerase FkpA
MKNRFRTFAIVIVASVIAWISQPMFTLAAEILAAPINGFVTVSVKERDGTLLQMRYIDISTGNGEPARKGYTVVVHYTGWLQNDDGSQGRKFDSSRDRGEPVTFVLGQQQAIIGWDEGVPGMKIGGVRRLVIPSAMAYGPRKFHNNLIPPNSNLIFNVELIKIY